MTIGQRKYIAGDCYPFGWFNAGDFGDNNLDNPDVMQVFQTAVYGLNSPPYGSDFFDSMDSCGYTYVDNGKGYLERNTYVPDNAARNPLFNGNDTTINQIAFGDGVLDVCDVYVTFRRSLDCSLVWFQRFWTNGILAAQIIPGCTNITTSSLKSRTDASKQVVSSVSPAIEFVAGDALASAGQTLQIPINVQIQGGYPVKVLMLNLTVQPLDGSPPLTQPIQFTPVAALGSPTPGFTGSQGAGNFTAAWLDSGIAGISDSNALLGTLTVTIPTNATSLSAYAIHFDHASASPNGLASFPKQTFTGLVTLSSRTSSSYGDGIPDSWRLRWFGTTNNLLSVSNACPTGDGINNWEKYVAGVDPNTANDFPSLNPKTPVPVRLHHRHSLAHRQRQTICHSAFQQPLPRQLDRHRHQYRYRRGHGI